MGSKAVETLVTAAELLEKHPAFACELEEGRIVRVSPAGWKHGKVLARIIAKVATFVERKKLGLVVSGETGFLVRRDPDTVRAPDLAFVSHATLGTSEPAGETYFPCAPDLAVEVLSPDDSWVKIEKKTREYLDAGAKAVWVVNPETESVHVYEGAAVRVLTKKDKIDGGDALRGFMTAVRGFFAP